MGKSMKPFLYSKELTDSKKKRQKEPEPVFKIDFMKAHKHADWNFLKCIMQQLRLGQKTWIKLSKALHFSVW